MSVSKCDPCCFQVCPAYPVLELGKIYRAEGIRLSDDWDEVDTCAEALHDLNVERLESVAGRSDEVQAGVDTEIDLLRTTRLLLLEHVGLVLVVQEFDDWLP